MLNKPPSRVVSKYGATAALVATIAMPVTAHHEGLRLKAYLDPVGIPTICYGETLNVTLSDVASKKECDIMFETRLGFFAYQVDMMTRTTLPPKTHAALTSFAYNVGVGAYKNSTLRRLADAGDLRGACNQLPRWNKAGGKVYNGLVKRREDERKLCLEGLENGV